MASWVRRKRLQPGPWKRARWAALRRDNFTCRRCSKVGGRLEIHHDPPLSHYKIGDKVGPYRPEGLKTLCRGCHVEVEREARQTGPYDYAAIQQWKDFVKDSIMTPDI